MDNAAARNIVANHSVVLTQGGAIRTDGPLHVERLMAMAFFPGRAPRSAEYHQGCQAALEFRILRRRMHPPYPAGCSEADAWLAGAEEGHSVWRRLYDSQQ